MKGALKTAFLLGLLGLTSPSVAGAETALRIGFLPVQPPAALAERFTPLLDRLAAGTNHRFEFVTAPTFSVFLDRTAKGDYDIVWTAPHFARLAQQKVGYEPVAAAGRRLQAFIMARRDGPKSLPDLKGKVLALVDPEALMTLLVLDHLEKSGLKEDRDFQARYFQSHPSAIEAVRKGSADAAGVSEVLAPPEGGDLVLLAKTEETSGMVFMLNPRLPEGTRRELRDALLSLGRTAEGEAALKRAKLDSLVPISSEDLRPMDRLLKKLKARSRR